MNITRAGIIAYRFVLVALFSYVAITLNEIDGRLSIPLPISGSVDATVKNTVGVISTDRFGMPAPLDVRVANSIPLNVNLPPSKGVVADSTPIRVEVVNVSPLNVEVSNISPLDVKVRNIEPVPVTVIR